MAGVDGAGALDEARQITEAGFDNTVAIIKKSVVTLSSDEEDEVVPKPVARKGIDRPA